MKRYGNLWGQISDVSNIRDACYKSVQSKKQTKDRKELIRNIESKIIEINDMLVNESYVFGPLFSFTVYEPKKREIHCPKFYPDRILHHCLMNVLAPLLITKFTADTYGSIPKKGVAALANNLTPILRNNPDYYFLQVDISKFYESIKSHIAKEAVRRVIKCTKTLRMIDAIIDVRGDGLPIGAYPSQYLANLVLSGIDHWIKEVLRVENYYRYMDDMLFIVPSKQDAHCILSRLKPEIEKLELKVKDNVRIAPISIGIDYVGYKFYPTHTMLRKRIKVNMQRNVKKLLKQGVSDQELKRQTASHFGWCKHANCRNLLRSTFKHKIYIYDKNMEIRRLSEIKEARNWFGLSKKRRVSIEKLFNLEVVFYEYCEISIRGEDKLAIRFAYPEDKEKQFYFITRSDVIRDRLIRDSEYMPFIATLKKVKNYTAYE